MQITVCKLRLTDGSHVYDLRLRQGGSEIRLACADEADCRRIASEMRDSARDTLEDVPEWEMVSVRE